MGLIRFLLACIVVLCHTSPVGNFKTIPSDIAVQSFYVISGFYMSLVLNEKYVGKNSIFTFYSNRFLKIYPIYFILLIVLILWAAYVNYNGYPGTFDFYKQYWPLPVVTILYLVFINLFLLGIDTVFYLGINPNGFLYFTKDINLSQPYVVQFVFNPFAWTIGVELLFYLIAPYIVRKKIWLPLGIFILSLLCRIYLQKIGLNFSPWTYMFFPNQLMFFMGGSISYCLYKHIHNNAKTIFLAKILLTLLIIMMLFYNQVHFNTYLKQTVLFLTEVLTIPYAFCLTKGANWDRYIGNLSYPMYLSQSLILRIVVAKSFPKLISYGFTALSITIILSILLHHLISQPLERYRQRRIAY